MIRTKGCLFKSLFLLMFITLLVTPLVHASPALNITVNTDRQNYWVMGSSIRIYGNLTLDNNQPVPDGLVAVEVQDPNNSPIVFRTLQTGTTLPAYTMNITEITTHDGGFNPKTVFCINSWVYFIVVVNNTSTETKVLFLTLNIYDGSNVPLGYVPVGGPAPPGPSMLLTQFWIPDWASIGTAKAYACTYSNWPSDGGTPYGPEKSESFTICAFKGAQASDTPTGADGTYSLSFGTSTKTLAGMYTVYVTSSYQGEQATNSTTFMVNVPDVNGDGYVNVWDLAGLSQAWLSESGDTNYNPNADFTEDGYINVWDLSKLSSAWLWGP